MAENLNYGVNDSGCYNDDYDNCDKYGRLYKWNAAKAACPSGWHLPTDSEWGTLISYAGGNNAGKKLKATNGWGTSLGANYNGTDNYGFSALPGGGYYSINVTIGVNITNFYDAGILGSGYWWTASEADGQNSSGYAQVRILSYNEDEALWNEYAKGALFSVRCVKGN